MFWKNKVKDVILSPSADVRVRVIQESDSDEIKEEKAVYPFKLHNDVTVEVRTEDYVFREKIPKGYIWNGADIPAPCWWFGSSKDNEFLIPSMVHDYLLEKKLEIYERHKILFETPQEYRRITSLVFREICKQSGINTLKSNVAGFCVDVYQRTLNKKAWCI